MDVMPSSSVRTVVFQSESVKLMHKHLGCIDGIIQGTVLGTIKFNSADFKSLSESELTELAFFTNGARPLLLEIVMIGDPGHIKLMGATMRDQFATVIGSPGTHVIGVTSHPGDELIQCR